VAQIVVGVEEFGKVSHRSKQRSRGKIGMESGLALIKAPAALQNFIAANLTARRQPDQNVDAGDFHTLGRLWKVLDFQIRWLDVDEYPVLFEKEMEVVGCFRIEIGFRSLDCDLAQQAGFDELMKRIVNSRERHRYTAPDGLGMNHLGGE